MITINNLLDVEKNINNIDAVIFDLDDTLYLEKDYVISGYMAIGRAYPEIKGLSELLWLAFQNGEQAIDYVLTKLGRFDNETKNTWLKIYREHNPSITLLPSVKEMLLRIKSSRKLGLITDGRPVGQHNKIMALGIAQYFDSIIVTDELGGIQFRKPCPIAFQIMQERMDIPYDKMCYVGDNLKKDFIAPKKLGIKCIYYNNKNGLY